MWYYIDKFLGMTLDAWWIFAWWLLPAIVVWLLRKRVKLALLTFAIFVGIPWGAFRLAAWFWSGSGFLQGIDEAVRAWFLSWVGAWVIVIWMLRRTSRKA